MPAIQANDRTISPLKDSSTSAKDMPPKNGLTIMDTYIDRAMTGTNDNREDFQRMLKDSDKKSFDYVLVET